MQPIIRLGGWLAAAMAIAVTILFNPVVAGYVFVVIAFTLIAGLAIDGALHAFGNWRLDHPLRLHRRGRG